MSEDWELSARDATTSIAAQIWRKARRAVLPVRRRTTGSQQVAVDAPPVLTMPEAEQALVRRAYSGARTLLEYGSGGSTLLAADLGVESIFCVESDAAWHAKMLKVLKDHPKGERVRLHHADIGPTKAWGRPMDDSAFRKWPDYPLAPWESSGFAAPDTILIDGRFRLACFLTALAKTDREVTILWDDYRDRPRYHVAEKVLKPVSMTGRLAVFEARAGLLGPEHLGLLARSYFDSE